MNTVVRPLPNPFAEAMPPWRLYFDLRGRVSRRQFWLHGVLALVGVALAAHALLGIARVSQNTADMAVNLLLLWPALAVSVKRWHDRDRSGWWVLVLLLPVVGVFWMLADNGCVRGTAGRNRYGEPPAAD